MVQVLNERPTRIIGRKFLLLVKLLLLAWLVLQFSSAMAVTVSVRVEANNDDAEERISDGDMYRDSSDLEIGYDSWVGGLQIVGMRFKNVAIPQGAIINSAYIEFETDETDSGTTRLVIFGQNADTANEFPSNDYGISSRPKTSASVDWNPSPWNSVNQLQQTSDISSVIKEIIDRTGWSSGNDLVIMIEPDTGCTNTDCQRTAESHEGESSAAPLLVVDYSTGPIGEVGSCAIYFPDTIQGHNNGSSVRFDRSGKVINDIDNILTFPRMSDRSRRSFSCNTTDCSINNSIAPALTLPTFITTSTSTDLTYTSGTSIISNTEIDQLDIYGSANVTFSASESTYVIDEAWFGGNSTVTFNPGTYWINTLGGFGYAGIYGNANIIINGPVTIYVNGQLDHLDIEDNAKVNIGGSAEDLAIVSYTHVHMKHNVQIKAVIYGAGSEVKLERNAQLTGSISAAGKVEIKDTSSVTYEDVSSVQVGDLCGGTPPVILPVADYHFDELSWNGTVNEVADSSGNNNHALANAASGLTTFDPGQVCRAGQFDGTDDYIQSSSIFNTLRTTASLSFWIKTTQTGDDTGWRATGITGVEQSGGTDDIFWGWLDATGRIGISVADDFSSKSTMAINNGLYRHVVLTRDSPTGAYKIYIDGSLDNSGTIGTGDIGTSFSSIGRIEDTGGTPEYFQGELDEVLVFDTVLSDAQVSTIYTEQLAGNNWDGGERSCPSAVVHHIQLIHDGAGLTCADESITVTACANADCSSVATSDVTVNLSATGAASSWDQNPVIIPANSNAGVTVSLTHRTAETITLDATASPVTTNSLTCIPDCELTFSDAGFILSLSDHQSCTSPNLVIQAVKLSDTGTDCAPAYSGNQSVDFTFNYSNPLTGSTIPQVDSTAMAAVSTAQNRSINFDGTASASLSFEYRDAGQINITVSDAGNNGLSAASVTPIVTPAKLLVSTSDTNNACTGPDYGGCIAFKVAGVAANAASQFNLDISAVCADNSITPNFQLNAIALSSNLVAPLGGSNATLGVTSANVTTAGTVTVQQTVTEVGAFSISATAPSYLGQLATLIPVATSSTIGRFIPDRFVLADNTPLFADATCDFTYQDQPFDFSPGVEPVMTLTAVNSAGATTLNYGGNAVANNDFWKLNVAALATRSYNNQVTSFPGTLTATLGSVNTAGETNYDGINTFTLPTDQLTYNKAAATPIALPGATNDSVFSATAKLILTAASLTDSDGVSYDPDDDGVSDSYSSNDITGTSIRWGRWFVANAFGSELQPLALIAEAQYFDGSNFLINSTDTCTTPVTVLLSNYTDNLSTGETTLTQGTMVSGLTPLTLSAPGNGNDGSLLLTLTTPAWMLYDYDGDTVLDNASATATFGIFEGRTPVIIKRQQF